MPRHTFRKEERLHSKKLIAELMASGKSFSFYPLRVVWLKQEIAGKFSAQVFFSVPKKKIKTAVQRNRIKRRLREAYRKNKHFLYEQLTKKSLLIALIYTSVEECSYKDIQSKLILALQRLSE